MKKIIEKISSELKQSYETKSSRYFYVCLDEDYRMEIEKILQKVNSLNEDILSFSGWADFYEDEIFLNFILKEKK